MPLSLEQRIAQFYDASSGLWEQTWGEHMHHGYYGPDGRQPKQRRQAQIDLIEALLAWADVTSPTPAILDAGCGIGGSSIYLAGRLQAEQVQGITLSPVQAQRAQQRAQEFGLANRVQFQVANALAMPFADESFDLVWSLESGEHMPNKPQFLQECCRVLRPGGRLILATWCHRPTTSTTPLTPAEQGLLQRIYDIYCLPPTISLPDYATLAQSLPLQQVQTTDWSKSVAHFWNDVMGSALNPTTILGILTSGWATIQGALVLPLMAQGYQQGLIRYGLLTGTKC